MDFLLETDELNRPYMTYSAVAGVENNISLSINVQKGSFFLDEEFGSLLHTIRTSSSSDVKLCERYCVDATAWMVKIGKLLSFSAAAAAVKDGIKIDCQAVLPDSTPVTYSTFVRIA